MPYDWMDVCNTQRLIVAHRTEACRIWRIPSLVSTMLWVALLLAPLTPTMAHSSSRQSVDEIAAISSALCDDMKTHHVLNPEAPVNCDRLRIVRFSYFGFDGRIHDDGELVVMDAVATHVLRIFVMLRNRHFPIAKALLLNHYEGNDDASMADNNTSAFNVRPFTGGGPLSVHAYGLAIDLNPVQNPYAKRADNSLVFSPPRGVDYNNRLDDRPWKDRRAGMAESVVDLFADEGFLIWGGYWDDPVDYQHFQVSRKLAEQLARLSSAEATAIFEKRVQQYRKCRRTSGPDGRVKCIMANERDSKNVDD
jgi:hypothetical protein